jgi:predicted metal-dependent peptidase
MPTAHSEAVCNLAISVDISSSVTDHEFDVFIGKIAEIIAVMKPQKTTVIPFNTVVITKGIQELTPDDDPLKKLKFKGRGGTNVTEVLQWAADNKPTVMLVFTDGEFHQVEPPDKSVPLVWLVHNSPSWKTKWGRVIHYNVI